MKPSVPHAQMDGWASDGNIAQENVLFYEQNLKQEKIKTPKHAFFSLTFLATNKTWNKISCMHARP